MNTIKDFLDYILSIFKIWVIIQPWEQGVKVRNGKSIKILPAGIYFKLPYFDSVYVQSIRLRVVNLPIQTVTSKDEKTITLAGSIGYSITDIKKLYQTLYSPDVTLSNMACNELSSFVCSNNLENINPEKVEKSVTDKLRENDYGIRFEFFTLNNFAVVKTFRFIQDHSWVMDGISLDQKKK